MHDHQHYHHQQQPQQHDRLGPSGQLPHAPRSPPQHDAEGAAADSMMVSPIKQQGQGGGSSSSAGGTARTAAASCSPGAMADPKRQRRSGPLPPTPADPWAAAPTMAAFRPPTAAELRVQGVGDMVEGTIAIQQRGQAQGQQQWSLDRLDTWRHRAFGGTAEGQEALRQQQREARRALLRQPVAAGGPTAMVSSPVKGAGASRRKGRGGGATGAVAAASTLSFGLSRGGSGGGGSQEEEGGAASQENGVWLPGHG